MFSVVFLILRRRTDSSRALLRLNRVASNLRTRVCVCVCERAGGAGGKRGPQRRVTAAWQTLHTSLARRGEPINGNRSAPRAAGPLLILDEIESERNVGGESKKRAKGERTKEPNKCKHKGRDSVEILKSTQEDKSWRGNVGKSLKENLSFLLQAGH